MLFVSTLLNISERGSKWNIHVNSTYKYVLYTLSFFSYIKMIFILIFFIGKKIGKKKERAEENEKFVFAFFLLMLRLYIHLNFKLTYHHHNRFYLPAFSFLLKTDKSFLRRKFIFGLNDKINEFSSFSSQGKTLKSSFYFCLFH